MLRTPTCRLASRLFSRTRRLSTLVRWAGVLLLGMAAGAAAACMAAGAAHDVGDDHIGVVQLLSAYHPPASMRAQARPATLPASLDPSPAQAQRKPPPLPASETSETSDGHAYKPLSMLAAALALMVSIALRRSRKR